MQTLIDWNRNLTTICDLILKLLFGVLLCFSVTYSYAYKSPGTKDCEQKTRCRAQLISKGGGYIYVLGSGNCMAFQGSNPTNNSVCGVSSYKQNGGCSANSVLSSGKCRCNAGSADTGTSCSEEPKQDDGCSTTNPISYSTGNKWLLETDYTSAHLSINRKYSQSRSLSQEKMGYGWVYSYYARIAELDTAQPIVPPEFQMTISSQGYQLGCSSTSAANPLDPIWTKSVTQCTSLVTNACAEMVYSGPCDPNNPVQNPCRRAYRYSCSYKSAPAIAVNRPSGKNLHFRYTNIGWRSDSDITDRLIEFKDASNVRTGWRYEVASTGVIETYDATGKLLSISDRSGFAQTLTYNSSGLLVNVSNALGHSLQFTYDTSSRIKTLTNPAGDVYTYAYNLSNNLVSVTYPDGNIKQYLYGETDQVSATPETGVVNANLLTGIIDELGVRYATYKYDAKGRAYAETLPEGADAANLAYTLDANGNPASTTVIDAHGSARTYNFTTILGVVKSTGNNQPAGAGCAASAANISYDTNGNMASRTDYNGNRTTYVYDLTRNLETSRTEGLDNAGNATTAIRTITTEWHPQWTLPQQITVYAGHTATGTPVKRSTYVYNDKGHVTAMTEEDSALGQSRTTTTTYTYSTTVPGLVSQKVVDGPRSDVSDVVTYAYYPHDASCTASTNGSSATNLGCRGQLQSITDALGKVTQYTRYNHHGQVEEMLDANNVASSYTYDKRQRLLSYSKGNETTTLTYDAAGQVTQLTLPDSSTLSYTYDDAHRLTDIQDTLGNKVHYSLDPMGNRIQEDHTDPQGNLAHTISRSYDALNRLQTLIGQE